MGTSPPPCIVCGGMMLPYSVLCVPCRGFHNIQCHSHSLFSSLQAKLCPDWARSQSSANSCYVSRAQIQISGGELLFAAQDWPLRGGWLVTSAGTWGRGWGHSQPHTYLFSMAIMCACMVQFILCSSFWYLVWRLLEEINCSLYIALCNNYVFMIIYAIN